MKHTGMRIGLRRQLYLRLRVIGFTLVFSMLSFCASAEDFTNAIRAFLEQRVQIEKRDVGIVIGIVDEQGSRVVSCGKLDNGTDQEVNGDTLFDIASITKPFTGFLLQDMIDRGEMKLDDPVQKYLPASVKMPSRNGKEITLLHLVTHTSGLPHIADNLAPKHVDQPFADYTVEELNAFLSGYKPTRDPGTKFEYSSLGAGLLGHVIALKAGSDYESLVVDRICRPLKMDSTRITLTPELKGRFATGHNRFGETVPSWDRQTQLGGSALRSTANDLLKFLSANLGLIPSSLTPVMEKTHVVRRRGTLGMGVDVGMAWLIARDPQGRKIIWHAGGAPGYITFAGFDKARRRGAVVLSSSYDLDVVGIGLLLLESEWRPEKRPKENRISSQLGNSLVGQYELSPDFALGLFILRALLSNVPKAIIFIPAALCLALLFILLRRAATVRKRCIILGCAAVASGVLAALVVFGSSRLVCALLHPGMGIRREQDRVFVQYHVRLSPVIARRVPPSALPHITGELLPESEFRLFERTTDIAMTLSRDNQGNVTRLTAHFLGGNFSHKRISDHPPMADPAPKPRVAIKLDAKLLDAVGQYEFAPHGTLPSGFKVTISREGDQLLWQAKGKNVIPGPFNIYPESETNFFIKVHCGQLTFIKNDKGAVTALRLNDDLWFPNGVGKKHESE